MKIRYFVLTGILCMILGYFITDSIYSQKDTFIELNPIKVEHSNDTFYIGSVWKDSKLKYYYYDKNYDVQVLDADYCYVNYNSDETPRITILEKYKNYSPVEIISGISHKNDSILVDKYIITIPYGTILNNFDIQKGLR